MNKAARVILRILTSLLLIAVVVVLLGSGLLYVLQDARDRTPDSDFVITVDSIEHELLGLYLSYKGDDTMAAPEPDSEKRVTFVVESGAALGTIATQLETAGLVQDGDTFQTLVQYNGLEYSIQAGVFSLSPSMDMETIMEQLQHGQIESAQVTIVEGLRVEEIAAQLEEAGVVSQNEFLTAVWNGQFEHDILADRPDEILSLEGYLFPDTYYLPLNTDADTVLQVMLDNLSQRLGDDLLAEIDDQGTTLYEALTMASIVEREAMVDEERGLIAGVYYNRLEQGMALQSDPTVQYSKGYSEADATWWAPMLQEEAQTVVSPYNTFMVLGLPPGPICNPGLASIEASVEPTESNYLYFYAKGDGTHAFATTYEEHLENQALYGG